MKKRRLSSITHAFLALLLSAVILPNSIADDIEIYEHGSCEIAQENRFIFIVDNSDSMNYTDFSNSKKTVDAAIDYVLASGLPEIQVAVVQYGSNSNADHSYQIAVPFTSDQTVAKAWSRNYGSGGRERSYHSDHLPAAFALMRRDNVYDTGNTLDVSDATNVQFVIFTDAFRKLDRGYCCSNLVAEPYSSFTTVPSYIEPGFGEYNLLKSGAVLPNGIKPQITVLHAPERLNRSDAIAAAAAIASVGGDYTGSIEDSGNDPEGAGSLPRRYILGDLTVNDTAKILNLLDNVIESISLATTLASPAVSVSAFNETRDSSKLYYSVFEPGRKKNWTGNVKSYRLSDEGVVVDARGNSIVDPTTGGMLPASRSFWSTEDDGDSVGSGGFAEKVDTNRTWYTEVGGVFQRVNSTSQIPAAAFGTDSNVDRDKAVNWALGYDSFDLNEDGDVSESNHYVADSLHASPLVVNFRKTSSSSAEVLFATSNLGMLHAINPETGGELWSYTPSELLGNFLDFNQDRDDINDHSYGLDGPLSFYAKETTISTTGTTLDTGYLYLTQRRGGDGIFALNISRALESTTPVDLLWKIDGGTGEFIDLGQSWSKPEIVTVALNCGTTCEYKDVLLFSGGYNPEYDNSTYRFSNPASTGHGNALYMVNPETGELLWSAGKRSSNSLQLNMQDSIPSAPVTIDTNGDGGIDVLFSADISGRVWRIDFDARATSMAELHVAGGLIANVGGSGIGNPRFFNRPDVVMSNSGSSVAYFSIGLGSGDRTSPLRDESGSNSVYFIRDHWVKRNPVRFDSATDKYIPDYRYVEDELSYSIIERTDLVEITTAEGSIGSANYGFYEDLPGAGEKVLAPLFTTGGKTLLITYLPPTSISVSTDSCSYKLGLSRLYVYDIFGSEKVDNIESTGTKSIDLTVGIVSELFLLDTGGSNGVSVLTGFESTSLDDILDTGQSNIRKIRRTSWVETEKLP
ncbi:MAG: pilus assembly protein [Granulosicoccus sp.]